jgi:hypothetical protein
LRARTRRGAAEKDKRGERDSGAKMRRTKPLCWRLQ